MKVSKQKFLGWVLLTAGWLVVIVCGLLLVTALILMLAAVVNPLRGIPVAIVTFAGMIGGFGLWSLGDRYLGEKPVSI